MMDTANIQSSICLGRQFLFLYSLIIKYFEVNIMKLIVISGGKHSKKDLLATRLASNSDCIWIPPFSNKKLPINVDEDRFISISDNQLSEMTTRENVIAETVVNGSRYVFFEKQLDADYVVIVGDDRIIFALENNFDGDMVTIRCHSNNEIGSPRFLLDDKEFDYVFNYDVDDYDTLEGMIV